MLLKKILLAFICLMAFNFAQAQQGQTEKMKLMKKDWIAVKSVTGENIAFTISEIGDNITVKANSSSNARLQGNYSGLVSGKITFSGGAEETFKRGTKITFPPNCLVLTNGQNVNIKGNLNADGSFKFTGVPKGTYKFIINEQVIAEGWKIGGE